MKSSLPGHGRTRAFVSLAALITMSLACARSVQTDSLSFWSISKEPQPTEVNTESEPVQVAWSLPTRRSADAPVYTPTPDSPHSLPPIRKDPEIYAVQVGDSLGLIANYYGISIEQIVSENELGNPNVLDVGQVLTIPVPTPRERGADFRIFCDSELVNGPVNILFDIDEFVQKQAGFLASYQEEVDEELLSGAQIVERIALDFLVNPRLLLAVLEHQSHWLSDPSPKKSTRQYPIGWADPIRKGLYRQLAWAANNLNRGYYLFRVNGVATWLLSDGTIVPIAPTINAGTAGVQQMYALLYDRSEWDIVVSEEGLFATYNALFGYPFDYTIEPIVPPDIEQPLMQLPFEPGKKWAFTSGPHGGWGDGAAWAALDFAPPGPALGCVQSDAWVVAVTDGQIVHAGNGVVIQDLDGDGLEQTGWVLLYMHIESRDRVEPGMYLEAGDLIGHPSCEGGVSSGTHVHIARKYNGEWIPADQEIPFELDGWISIGSGVEYDGFLKRGARSIEAYAGRSEDNTIKR